ncbi:starch phosphorylase [Lachnospiraceae bacterium PF1-21]|uniref:glycogen/starch/alpha-glucan phosphorylase n=1 Tax=Ohessyouella blattaphilus TaxID=2949333 RepID=UPI003E241DDD
MFDKRLDKKKFKEEVESNLKLLYRHTIAEASQQELFQAVSYAVKEVIMDDWISTQKAVKEQGAKTVVYLSMEFLIGRALGNNLINMNSYRQVEDCLAEMGIDLNALENQEPDPALGNGGLGRLAACFLESLTTLGYPAYGCGIRYRYGMFKQKIENGYQREVPDDWLKDGYPFELRRPDFTQEVRFGGTIHFEKDANGDDCFIQENYQSVKAVPYEIPIVGYGNHMVNSLCIWDAEPIVNFNLDSFDSGNYHKAVEQENIAKNIVEVLYPNDNHIAGKELRLKQQYFFISASLQSALQKFKQTGASIFTLPDKVVFQMNDTHPTVAVAELMRLLLDQEHLSWDEAWGITTKCVAYTNHTIMSEALEKWPIDLFERLLPRVYQIVQEIDRRFVAEVRSRYPGNEEKVAKMAILYDKQVRMAHLAIVASYSVNGVAALHTEILKHQELKDFYEMMPDKFNNKTNGVTQRRFLMHANPWLSDWITLELKTTAWATNLDLLSGLKDLVDNPEAQSDFMEIKKQNKIRLAQYIKEHNGIEVDPESLFDIQVKRLHEYKRQLLNILHVIYLYNQIKENPAQEVQKRTFIFGAKASAGYIRAKEIIKLITSVAEVVNNDASIDGKIKVVFIEDYKVSNAEIIFSAADLSEQISTASKEASGTGNMKFMMNGGVTIGTMDGANVEIVEAVGAENAFIFGLSSEEVIQYENHGGYNPQDIYNSDPKLRQVIDQLVDGTFAGGDREMFRNIYDSLLTNKSGRADQYFILKDFDSYRQAQAAAVAAYSDKSAWARMAMMNTACSGKFSSDRTIEEYVRDIWHSQKIQVEGK